MLKSLRVPDRLFRLAMWAVSFVFASFLIALGGKIVGDLPGVDQRISPEQFMDPAVVARDRVVRDSLVVRQRDLAADRERAGLALTAASNAYQATRGSFENWIRTRVATTDPRTAPEVVRGTRGLDVLKDGERQAQSEADRLDAALLAVSQAGDVRQQREAERYESARSRFERARFRQELRVFAIRLALTLPLLVVAGWL